MVCYNSRDSDSKSKYKDYNASYDNGTLLAQINFSYFRKYSDSFMLVTGYVLKTVIQIHCRLLYTAE